MKDKSFLYTFMARKMCHAKEYMLGNEKGACMRMDELQVIRWFVALLKRERSMLKMDPKQKKQIFTDSRKKKERK